MVKYFERFRNKCGMIQDANSHPIAPMGSDIVSNAFYSSHLNFASQNPHQNSSEFGPLSTERGENSPQFASQIFPPHTRGVVKNLPRVRGKTAKAVRGSCAFTLVELIVVIVILAILGTISFISLQNYSSSARDTKRVNDVKSLISKITIENVKGVDLSQLISTGIIDYSTGMTIYGVEDEVVIGTPNFGNLNENENNFKDPKTKSGYLMAYSVNTQRVAGMYKSETTGKNVCIGEVQLFEVLGKNWCDSESSGIPITPNPQITYSWEVGEYGSCENLTCSNYSGFGTCSQTCGGGTQINTCNEASGTKTREVKCKNSNDEIVADNYCTEPKPETDTNCTITENLTTFNQEQSCNTEACANCDTYELETCPTTANCSQCTEGVGANNKWKIDSCKEHYSTLETGCNTAETKTFTCENTKPANSVWNTISSYQQTWDGTTFVPADSTTTYNTEASTTSCRYKCSSGYTWVNSVCNQNCSATTNNGYSVPATNGGATTSTITKSVSITGGTQTKQTTFTCNSGIFTQNTESISITCNSGYTQSGDTCVANSCASYTSGNGTFTTGTPIAPNTAWQTTSSSSPCYVSCSSGYKFDGTKCSPCSITTSGTDITITCNGASYTIADRNLGATATGGSSCSSSACRGNHYQWGRNRGFSSASSSAPNTSQSAITASTRETNTNFIWNSSLSSNRYDWSTTQEDHLWGDTSTSNGSITGSNQGPCASGRHVPTTLEWDGLVKAWFAYKGVSCTASAGNSCSYSGNATLANFQADFNLPLAGRRGRSVVTLYYQGSSGLYWSSSPRGSSARGLAFDSSSVSPQGSYDRANGFSVRCFKN